MCSRGDNLPSFPPRISIANAELALSRGDADQALSLLQTITEDKPYFIRAKEKMATIYITHKCVVSLESLHKRVPIDRIFIRRCINSAYSWAFNLVESLGVCTDLSLTRGI